MEQAELGTRRSYPLPMTQEQLSEALGLTPVHVNRTLKALRCAALIRTEHRMVHIDNWDRLVTIAEFDPMFLLLGDTQDGDAGTGLPWSHRMVG